MWGARPPGREDCARSRYRFGFDDPESGVGYYRVYVAVAGGPLNESYAVAPPVNVGPFDNLAATFTGLSLEDGHYTAVVTAFNGVRNPLSTSVRSHTVVVDSSPPVDGDVRMVNRFIGAPVQDEVRWLQEVDVPVMYSAMGAVMS